MHDLERKLQKKESSAPILVVNMPEELESLFDGFVSPVVQAKKHKYFAMIMVFGQKMAKLQATARQVLPVLSPDGLLWICYPKKSSKRYQTSDCSRDALIGLLAEDGFETVRQVAVNEDWSGLRYRNAKHIKKMKRSFAVTEEGKKKVKRDSEKS